MKITHEALSLLAMVNGSCRTFQEKKRANLKYLVDCARSGQDLDFPSFESGFPQKSLMYRSILGFAAVSGKKVIDREAILRFFGGVGHIDYTLDQIRAVRLQEKDPAFADKLLFAHLLTPVRITSCGERISAQYQNGETGVGLENLIVHPWVKEELVPGKMVLVHYAVIVDAHPSKGEAEWLLKEQARGKEFLEAARHVRRLDFEKFWNLKAWTEELLGECLK